MAFLSSPKMEREKKYPSSFISPRNKSKRLKEKNYFGRFNRLNVYSHVKDNKIHVGIRWEIFTKSLNEMSQPFLVIREVIESPSIIWVHVF